MHCCSKTKILYRDSAAALPSAAAAAVAAAVAAVAVAAVAAVAGYCGFVLSRIFPDVLLKVCLNTKPQTLNPKPQTLNPKP